MVRAFDVDSWELAYQRRPTAGYLESGRHEPWVEAIVPRFEAAHVCRVLDLGCGDGRNMVYLAARGFEPSGIDSAPTAIDHARAWLRREAIAEDLEIGEMSCLRWPNGHFQAAISIMAFHHQTRDQLVRAVAELTRVLAPGALFFADLLSARHLQDWVDRTQGQEIETGTWVPTIGHEVGVVHHFFAREEMQHLFTGFELEFLDEGERYWILGRRRQT